MKTNLLSLFIFIFCFNSVSSAQTPYTGYIAFPEDSAQWSEWFSGYDNWGNFFIQSMQYKMKGDTILNGISYNKIYLSTDLYYGANDTLIHSFIRQDTAQKKVFIRFPFSSYADTADYLLYDFTLTDQDTFYLKLIADGQLHRFKIDGDDTTQFNYDFRRVLGFYPIDSCPPYCGTWGIDCDNPHAWSEGIGNWLHPFFIELAPDTCRSPSIYFFNLECFWHHGQYVFGGTFCDVNTGIKDDFIGNNNHLLIYPNPVTDNSVLFNSGKNLTGVTVIDPIRRTVKTLTIKQGMDYIAITKNDYPAGVYLIKAVNKSGDLFTAKFIVLN